MNVLFPGKRDNIDGLNVINLRYEDSVYSSILIEETYPCLVVQNKNPIVNILYFHGNGENLKDVNTIATALCDEFSIRIFCPEYKGYSNRCGTSTEKDCYSIGYHTFCYIKNLYQQPIVVVGYSIGSGIASYIAEILQKQIYGTVLINAFSSIKDLVDEKFSSIPSTFINMYIGDIFPNFSRLKNYKGRLICIHGKKDDVIPFYNSEKIINECSSNNKKLIVYDNLDHCNVDWKYHILIPIMKSWFQ